MEDDVQFERHYRARRDLELELKRPRREYVDGSHLHGSASGRGDDLNQPAGTVLKIAEGHVVRLSEAEAAEHLESGALVPAP